MIEPFYRGEFVQLTVTVTADGVPVDIASGPFKVTALEYTLGVTLDGAGILISKALADMTLLPQSGATLGKATITIPTSQMRDIAPGDYWEQVMVAFESAPNDYEYVIPPRRRLVRGVVKIPA